jgi:hypothetical protein
MRIRFFLIYFSNGKQDSVFIGEIILKTKDKVFYFVLRNASGAILKRSKVVHYL